LEDADVTDPMKFFANPGIVPEVEITKTVRRSRYNLNFFHYESFVETPHRANNTVHGRLYEIHGKPDAPTVIVLHGWHMESYNFFDHYCRLLVQSGFNAALVDLPYHMNRRVPNSFHGEYTFSDDAVLTVLVMKQCVLDVEGTINWVKSRGARLIGMFGISYGGMLSGLVGCVEPSVDFMMLVAPPADLFDFFTKSRLGRLFESQNPRMFEEMKRNKEVFDRISLVNLTPQMPPERIFLVMAEYDGMVRSEMIEKLWHAWNRPHMERYLHGHLSVILFNPSMHRDMRRWLKTVYDPEAQASQSPSAGKS
ncbi:MAG: alpha/beta hydrolase, partial [bacterium]